MANIKTRTIITPNQDEIFCLIKIALATNPDMVAEWLVNLTGFEETFNSKIIPKIENDQTINFHLYLDNLEGNGYNLSNSNGGLNNDC